MSININDKFEADNDVWRVKSITENFVIATRASVDGEPEHPDDIKKVYINDLRITEHVYE